jgi:hypothetical protein
VSAQLKSPGRWPRRAAHTAPGFWYAVDEGISAVHAPLAYPGTVGYNALLIKVKLRRKFLTKESTQNP